jgi:hypothetical protein
MDPMLQTLLSWQLVMFGLTIVGIMYVIRPIVEYFMTPKTTKFWETVFIPSMHIILGALLGYFFTSFPYPDQLINCWDRLVFGIVAGLLSEPIYRLIQYILSPKTSLILQIINAIAQLLGKAPKNQENENKDKDE